MAAPFRDFYLYPMAAAVWSTPAMRVGEYPAEAFIRFSLNHGLLDLIDRPAWRTVIGGSRVYVAALAEPLGRALIGRAAVGVRRTEDGVDVTDAAGETRRYDRLVLATHADEALRLIDAADPVGTRAFGRIPLYPQRCDAAHRLPGDATPARGLVKLELHGARDRRRDDRLSVTYWMNRLQSLPGRPPMFLSLNPLFEHSRFAGSSPDAVRASDVHRRDARGPEAAVVAAGRRRRLVLRRLFRLRLP